MVFLPLHRLATHTHRERVPRGDSYSKRKRNDRFWSSYLYLNCPYISTQSDIQKSPHNNAGVSAQEHSDHISQTTDSAKNKQRNTNEASPRLFSRFDDHSGSLWPHQLIVKVRGTHALTPQPAALLQRGCARRTRLTRASKVVVFLRKTVRPVRALGTAPA